MSKLRANEEGVIRGSFLVPDDQPAGTHVVDAIGSMGREAAAAFSGEGTQRITSIQTFRTTTLTTTRFRRRSPPPPPPRPVIRRRVIRRRRIDPLAQTFTLERDTFVAAVDFWVHNRGFKPLLLQLRTCENGMPTQDILTERRIEVNDVTNVGNNEHTRVNFAPVMLTAGVEYCFVLLSDDNAWAVEIAELGERDERANKVVTSQPFQIGVLLSSSNASTWTPHQKADLRFRLHEAVFSTPIRNYALGSFDLYNADLIHAQFTADRIDEDTDVTVVVTMPDGKTQYRLKEDTIASFSEKVTGKAQVKLELTGTPAKTPVVMNGVTLVSSGVVETGEYVTRNIPVGDDADVMVTFESSVGLESSVEAFYATGTKWLPLPMSRQINIGDGFNERTYKLENISTETIRVKLVLKGTARDAPVVRKLRVVTI